jgi:hypothetical protein
VLFVRQWPRCPLPQILRNKYTAFSVAEHAGNGLMHTGIAVIPIGIDLFPTGIRPFSIGIVLIPVGIGSKSIGIASFPIDIGPFSIGTALIQIGIVSIPTGNGVIPVCIGAIPIDFRAMQTVNKRYLPCFTQCCIAILLISSTDLHSDFSSV